MLKILFQVETENDYFTPISIANAILKTDFLENEDIEEIAEKVEKVLAMIICKGDMA